MTYPESTFIPKTISLPTGTSTGLEGIELMYPVVRHPEEFIIDDPTRRHLKKSVLVIVEPTESGNWVARHPVIRTHGFGANAVDAVKDFHDMMIGLFLELVDTEDELAFHLRQELDYLREIIVEESVR